MSYHKDHWDYKRPRKVTVRQGGRDLKEVLPEQIKRGDVVCSPIGGERLRRSHKGERRGRR